MRLFHYCRHIATFLAVLLALAYTVSVPTCYAKAKKHPAKTHNILKSHTNNSPNKTQSIKKGVHRTQSVKKSALRTQSVRNSALRAQIVRKFDAESCLTGIPFGETLSEYVGIPYQRGGTGSSGIDCSGLSRRFYLEVFGLTLPHNSAAQRQLSIFEDLPLDPDSFESSDLLFFNDKGRRINHVGIYLEDGKFLHATPKGGVIISSLEDSHWKQRLVASRRIKDTVLAKAAGSEMSTAATGANEISLGYTADVDKNLHFNLETFYSGRGMDQSPRQRHPIPPLLKGPIPPAILSDNLGPWQGIRASANIRPTPWLEITPSLGMLDGPSWGGEGSSTSWQVYGLQTTVSPAASQWSLVLSLHSLLNDSYYNTYKNASDTDIGLHFNYMISKTARLSVIGNWEGSYLMRDSAANDDNRDNRNVSFNLNFSF